MIPVNQNSNSTRSDIFKVFLVRSFTEEFSDWRINKSFINVWLKFNGISMKHSSRA